MNVERLKQILKVAQEKAQYLIVTLTNGDKRFITVRPDKVYEGFMDANIWDGYSYEEKITKRELIFLNAIASIQLEGDRIPEKY